MCFTQCLHANAQTQVLTENLQVNLWLATTQFDKIPIYYGVSYMENLSHINETKLSTVLFTDFYLKPSSWEIFARAEQKEPRRPRRIS